MSPGTIAIALIEYNQPELTLPVPKIPAQLVVNDGIVGNRPGNLEIRPDIG